MNNTLTALHGVRVGHATHLDKLTGCTAILFDKPFAVSYKSYGGAVGAFNTESLKSDKTDYGERGIFIAGGSMTGLMSASNIMQCMIEDKIAKSDAAFNPSVTGAIIYDLGMWVDQYDPAYGAEAYKNANAEPVQSGNVGAGTGASVGGFRWLEEGKRLPKMKAGVGSARIDLPNGITICALSVVNALGNVILPDGQILAGNREEGGGIKSYADLQDFVTKPDHANTTISVVGINVDLGPRQHYEKLAHLATQGQVRAINPVHTSSDGDTVFVFSNREIKKPFNKWAQYFQDVEDPGFFLVDVLGQAAAQTVQESIYDACRQAETVQFALGYQGVVPSAKDYGTDPLQ